MLQKAINIKEFEHLFKEKTLKRGLSIVKNNRLSFSKGQGGIQDHFTFNDKKNTRLEIKRLGEKITFYNCSCKLDKCEHLCAAIFYFQSETFKSLLSEDRLKRRDGPNDIFKKQCLSLREKLKNEFFSHETGLKKLISGFIKERKKNNKEDALIHLAILNELTGSLKYKNAGNESIIQDVITESTSHLKKIFKGKVSEAEKQACISACFNSLSTSQRFNTKLFCFLIPYVSIFIKNKTEIDLLKSELAKQPLKLQPPGAQDWKLIAQLHLERAEAILTGRRRKKANSGSTEFFITEAEREWVKGNIAAGFKILNEGYQVIRISKPAGLLSFLEYSIEKAVEYKNEKDELLFIQQILIYDSHIHPKYLKRIKELLSIEERKELVDKIISEVKKSHHDTFEKLNEIMLSEERYDELVIEISKQKGKFRLLNEIAIKKLPQYDKGLLKIYVKQFQLAINAALETHYQKQIFNSARKYIDNLPIETRQKLVADLLEVTGKHSYIRSSILKLYYS